MIAIFSLAALAGAAPQDTTKADSVVRLGEVVVVGTREPAVSRLEQPAAIAVAVVRESDRAAGRLVPDLLRDLPGVQVQQTSAGQGSVILRGLLGNQVLLLVDGIPLNNGTYRDGPGQYLATIDPETIERIEVIRGPASVLYGSDAQGGVVNLITRPHPGAPDRSVKVAGRLTTANEGYRGRVSSRVSGGRVVFELGGGIATAGDLAPGGGRPPQRPTGFDAVGIDARVEYEPAPRQRLIGVAQHFGMSDVFRYDRYVDFRAPTPGPDFEHRFDPQTRQLAYVRYRHEPGRPLLARLEATASLSVQREGRFQRRLLENGQPDSVLEHLRDDAYTPGLSVVASSLPSVANRPVHVVWGAEYYHDRLASRGVTEVLTTGERTPITRMDGAASVPSGRFPDDAAAQRLGAFVSAVSDIAPWLRASVGGRWSRFRTSARVGDEFGGGATSTTADLTGQLGLVARPAEHWRLAFRLAEGFRAPNLYDLTNVGAVPGGVIVPNPDATPERSLSTEVGVRYSGLRVTVDLTGYHTAIRGFIDRVPATFGGDTLFRGERVFQGRNVGRASVRGLEMDTGVRFGVVEARATILYTRGEQTVGDGDTAPMSKIPPLGGSMSVRWYPTGGAWVESSLRWADAQRRLGERDRFDSRIQPGGTPGFAALGVRAGTTVAEGFTVSGGLENITDELYREHASGVDAAGRHLWVAVSWLAAW